MGPSNENKQPRNRVNEIITLGLFLERERRPMIIVSSFQVAFGLLCVIIGAFASVWIERILALLREVAPSSTPPYSLVQSYTELWAGCLFVLTGSIGISSAKKNQRGLIVGHIVLNVFMMLAVTWVVIIIPSINVAFDCTACCYSGGFLMGSSPCAAQYSWNASWIDLCRSFDATVYNNWYTRYQTTCFDMQGLESSIVCIACAMFIATMAGLIYDSKALCHCCRVCDYLSEIHEHLNAITLAQAMPEPVGGQTAKVTESLVYERDDNSIYEQISSRDMYATDAFLRERAQRAGVYVEEATEQADSEGYSYCTEFPKRSLPSRPSGTDLSKEPKPDKMDSPAELNPAGYIDVICD